MPLPAALLKRLATRGLVNKDSEKRPRLGTNREEIIAEDYGEVDDPYNYEIAKKPEENFWIERMKRRMAEGNNAGYKGCPNKYNIFHKCTLFCVNRWGDGVLEPNREYLKRRSRLLKKYTLPKNWLEVYDYGCGVHYYWNTTDDTVAWLPPSHPKSQITKSAASLRRELEETLPPPEEEEDDGAELTAQEIHKILQAPMLPNSPKRPESPPDIPPPVIIKKPKSRDLDKALRRNSRKNKSSKESEPLDPMDPAAYSDIPRGKWSDGLNMENTKSGVDPTAAGALFQMRPYPSPGAVLQANAAVERNKKSGEEGD